jgi:hypothetical protein
MPRRSGRPVRANGPCAQSVDCSRICASRVPGSFHGEMEPPPLLVGERAGPAGARGRRGRGPNTLVKALARAWHWQQLLDDGVPTR